MVMRDDAVGCRKSGEEERTRKWLEEVLVSLGAAEEKRRAFFGACLPRKWTRSQPRSIQKSDGCALWRPHMLGFVERVFRVLRGTTLKVEQSNTSG